MSRVPNDPWSVRGSSFEDPFLFLAGDPGDQLEIGVVVEDDQSTSFCRNGHDGVDERQGPVATLCRERRLHLERPLVVRFGNRDRRECQEPAVMAM